MGRPKLSEELKKEKINLTVSKEVKEMAESLREEKNISISELLETTIRKEYKKLLKSKK